MRKNNRILIIDDDPLVCQTLEEMAESCGFEVLTTDSCISFFAQLVLFEPGVIIVDLHMPDQDGVQLIRQLAELNNNAQLVIVSGLEPKVLTSAANTATELGLGVLGILHKPVPLTRMRQLLTFYLNTPSKLTQRSTHWQEHIRNKDWMPAQEDLIEVIEKDLLTVNYQPQLDCRTGQLLGFEALARWDVPGKGIVTPDVFVPLAEGSHLVSQMTYNIARKGISVLKEMQNSEVLGNHKKLLNIGHQALTMSINITAKCLEDTDLPEQLEELCVAHEVNPADVILEISESNTMQDPVRLLETLTRLRIKTFQLSIDDFGTGYSSMLHLVRMPFMEIKIDKEFVNSADSSEEARLVIKSIIDLAQSLGMRSVAEGVETQTTLDFLTQCGCSAFQGFLISKPMAKSDLTTWISGYRPAQIQ